LGQDSASALSSIFSLITVASQSSTQQCGVTITPLDPDDSDHESNETTSLGDKRIGIRTSVKQLTDHVISGLEEALHKEPELGRCVNMLNGYIQPLLKLQTTKGMKSDNGVAEEVKLDSNQSMPERKLEASNLLTEERFRRRLCSD
ncbi:hypothetical protein SLEP1_g58519, partial [Rubroshorea leprosula]